MVYLTKRQREKLKKLLGEEFDYQYGVQGVQRK